MDLAPPLPRRLQATRTPKFVRGFVSFLAYFMVKHGPATVATTMDRVQPGIFVMLVQQVGGGSQVYLEVAGPGTETS